MPWQTWRERQRPPKLTRRQFAVGCASLSVYGAATLIALVLGIVVPLALMTVGINALAGWMVGLLVTPPLPALARLGVVSHRDGTVGARNDSQRQDRRDRGVDHPGLDRPGARPGRRRTTARVPCVLMSCLRSSAARVTPTCPSATARASSGRLVPSAGARYRLGHFGMSGNPSHPSWKPESFCLGRGLAFDSSEPPTKATTPPAITR